jgi:hypothetical protein
MIRFEDSRNVITAAQPGVAPDPSQLRSFLATLLRAGELSRCGAAPTPMQVRRFDDGWSISLQVGGSAVLAQLGGVWVC